MGWNVTNVAVIANGLLNNYELKLRLFVFIESHAGGLSHQIIFLQIRYGLLCVYVLKANCSVDNVLQQSRYLLFLFCNVPILKHFLQY